MRAALASIFLALCLPGGAFWATALAKGMGLDQGTSALAAQFTAPRLNLFVLGGLNAAPVLLLALGLGLARKRGLGAQRWAMLFVAGLLPVLAVELWAQFSFWRLFLPERKAPGFPHGLELALGPLLYAPVAMLICVVVAALSSRGNSANPPTNG